jgi:hypothetical protein
MTQPDSIAGVLSELDRIIDWARGRENCLGYFPALYRKVTRAVAINIEGGFFDDAARMERLDVAFAQRYLHALQQWRQGTRVNESWRIAFEASNRWWPIVLQHLLLGINAHINLDLGIAAAHTSPGGEILGLKSDFDKINDILLGLVEQVEKELNAVWPLLPLLDRVAGRTDEALINFSMQKARAHAWKVAAGLAAQSGEQQIATI